jgi:hypothetical protein
LEFVELRLQIRGRPEQDAVQIFAPNGANQPFNEGMGERRVRHRLDLPDVEDAQIRLPLVEPIQGIVVRTEIPRRGLASCRAIEHPAQSHAIHLATMHAKAHDAVEEGVPLAQVRDLLGHASITTTERYDNQTLENLQMAVTKLERGRVFAPGAAGAEATAPHRAVLSSRRRPRTKFQDSFKIEGSDARSDVIEGVPAIEPNELTDLNLGDWLGVRDGIRNWLQTAA